MIAISLDKMVMTAMEMDWHTRNTDTNESQFKREDYSRSRVCVLSNMCKHIGSFGSFYTYYTALGIKALFLQPDEVMVASQRVRYIMLYSLSHVP